MKHVGMNASHIVYLKLTYMVVTVMHHTTHARDGKVKRHNYYTAPFRSSHTDCDQWGYNHRGLTRSDNWFHNTCPCGYCNNVFHAHNTNGNN